MSAADYFTPTALVAQTLARASAVNTNLTAIETGFGRLPDKVITDTGRITFAVTGGAADVYTLALHKTAAAYYNGMALDIEVHATNTGACTINVDSLGAKSIKIMNGTDPAAGDLTAGDYLTLRYDDTNGYFVITSTVRSIINGQAAMSDAEIKTAYENNANTNAFTDAQQTKVNYLTVTGAVDLDSMNTKLGGIEAGATADQSNAEIKTAYEANSNTNAYTDAEQTKVGYLTVTGAIDLDTLTAVSKTSSGAITVGDPVAINTGGTVSTIDTTPTTVDEGTLRNSFKVLGSTSTEGVSMLQTSDPDKYLIFYFNSTGGEVAVITIDQDDIDAAFSIGTGTVYDAARDQDASSAVWLDEARTKWAHVYGDGAALKMVVGHVSGDGIGTVGTPITVDASNGGTSAFSQQLICKINEDKVVVTADHLAYVVDISGVTPTAGSSQTIATGATEAACYHVGGGTVLFAYETSGNALGVKAGTVAGTTITFGSEDTDATAGYASGNNMFPSDTYGEIVLFTADHAAVISVDGVTATIGTMLDINSTSAGAIAYDGTNYIVMAKSGSFFEVDTVTKSGTTLTLASEIVTGKAFPGTQYRPAFAQVKGNRFFIVSQNAVDYDLDGFMFDLSSDAWTRFIGYATATVADATSVGVIPKGNVSSNQSGLTAATRYYYDYDMALTSSKTPLYAGIALSSTELMLNGGFPDVPAN